MFVAYNLQLILKKIVNQKVNLINILESKLFEDCDRECVYQRSYKILNCMKKLRTQS